MAIWRMEIDPEDFGQYRKWLRDHGFISTNYFSVNGFNITKMREMALAGKMDAMRCTIGRSVRWYYREDQAELARLKGELELT